MLEAPDPRETGPRREMTTFSAIPKQWTSSAHGNSDREDRWEAEHGDKIGIIMHARIV